MDINESAGNTKTYSVQKFTYIKIVLFCFNVSCFQGAFISFCGLVLASQT